MMKQMTTLAAAILLALGLSAAPAFAGHHENPCNPCMKKHNPCSIKKHNPCEKSEHNPCEMKKSMNPCNPCAMKAQDKH